MKAATYHHRHSKRVQLHGAAATLIIFWGIATSTQATTAPPKGLMLNLDFQNIEGRLIPSKTLYPLYVPQNELGVITNKSNNRVMLMVEAGQGLDIPHSSLLDPSGSGWIASVRIFALSNGLIMSQGDDEKGYAIYMKDGAIHAAIRTDHSTIILKERTENGITDYLNKWVTIELKFGPDMAILILNRARVAVAPIQAPLSGNNYRIRVGQHEALPAALQRDKTATTTGFTGGISSLKILRQ